MPTYSPQSSFRTYLGVAKDTVNGLLTTAITTGATSIPLTNINGSAAITSAGATYTAFILDGNETESVACSGNLTAGAIACGATANAHNANCYVYFQLTASPGPTAYMPVSKVEMSTTYDQLYDKGYRGSQADSYGAQQGMRLGNISLEGNLFADSFGYMLGSFFGAYDYTATSGGNPTTYAFSPQNTGNGQPPAYLFYYFNPGDGDMWVYGRSVIGTLDIKFDPKTLCTWTATGLAIAGGNLGAPGGTPSFSSFTPVASRVGGAIIGGTNVPDLLTCDISLKREEFAAVDTIQGQQDPLAIFSGPVAATAKWSMVQGDDTQLNDYYLQTQPTFEIKAVKGTGTAANGIDIHFNQANYEGVKISPTGKSFVTLDGGHTGIANTTDASTAGTGYSPVRVTLSTGTTTGASIF